MTTKINGRTPAELKGLLANRRSFTINTEGIFDDALAYIQRLEEVVMLMVLQYCQADGKLDHLFMCAGEQAFAVLGLEQYAPIETLHKLMDDAGV